MAWYDNPIPLGGNIPQAGGWMPAANPNEVMPQLPSNQWPLAFPSDQPIPQIAPSEPPPKLWTMVEQRLKDILAQDKLPYFAQPQTPTERAQNEMALMFLQPQVYAAQQVAGGKEDKIAQQEEVAKQKKLMGIHSRFQNLSKRIDSFQKNKAPESIRMQTEKQWNALVDQLEELDPESAGTYDRFAGEGDFSLQAEKEARQAKREEMRQFFEPVTNAFGKLGVLIGADQTIDQAFPNKEEAAAVRQEIISQAPSKDPAARTDATIKVLESKVADTKLPAASRDTLAAFIEQARAYTDQLEKQNVPGAIYQDLMKRMLRQLGRTWVKKPELTPMEAQPFMGPSTTRESTIGNWSLRRPITTPWEPEQEPGAPPWGNNSKTLDQMVR